MVFFQISDYTRLRSVSYREFGVDNVMSMAVSGRYVVALRGWHGQSAHAYSLPGLQPQSELEYVGSGCLNIRADSQGQVFVGCRGCVVMLAISETGNLTFWRSLTAQGRLSGRENIVAVDYTPGQLWVSCVSGPLESKTVYLITVDNDSVIQSIQMSVALSSRFFAVHVSQLLTDELLVTIYDYNPNGWTVLVYQSNITLPPTNLKVTGHVRLSHRNHFLLVDQQTNTILILDSQGDLVHTVDDLNGKHGIWMQIQDIAVWENNLLVSDWNGGVVFLSML